MDASLFVDLLPVETGLRIENATLENSAVVVELHTTTPCAKCPECNSESTSIHGHYRRRLQDQPCRGQTLRLSIVARKFACRRAECPRKVFCERLPGLAEPQARTTTELADSHRSIGFALGGEAGSRLAAKLSLPTSPDTILRRVKNAADEPTPPPRFVGIDDWAYRKGLTYSTILIDLERRCVIDLLPGRDGEALKQWLAKNPQVKVITRDRWPAYIEAATASAPQAKQVADRFHLLRNVREAVEKLLSRHGSQIRTASAEADSVAAMSTNAPANEMPSVPEVPAVAKPMSKKEQLRGEKQRIREEKFRQVKELTAQGESSRAIARRLGINVNVVHKYRRLEACPDWTPGRTSATQLDPFAKFIADWVATGNLNSADLYRLLKAQGFVGSYDAVRRYVTKLLGSSGRPGRRDPETKPARQAPPSVRKLSFAVVKPRPGKRTTRILEHLRRRDEKLHGTLNLAEELMGMIRRTKSISLKEWTAKADASGDRDLVNLAKSLKGDSAAVEAALTGSWSNGPVEGQVNRLKTIKRQMYGRAGMALLRARVKRKG
jgi:transposase